ncbi:MAG: zinc ABC transporter substrate-binding protein, partial [Pseudomonadota bacterium]|nr:zinc ABC transporter substrate-binding protein [Pseudomonadota bacterium]
MTKRKSSLKLLSAILVLFFAVPAFAQSDKPIPVVATFSIVGDMVKRIGGPHVALSTLVGPDGDTHVYQPTPADARAVSKAKLLFVNGLEFEGWIDRLVKASGFKGTRVVTTEGIKSIPFEEGHDDHGKEEHHKDEQGEGAHHKDDHHKHGHDDHKKDEHKDGHAEHAKHGDDDHKKGDHKDHGDHHGHDHGAFDPHAWQSLNHAVTYVDNITAALVKAFPVKAAAFNTNRAAYVAEIKALDAEVRDMIAKLPKSKRTVVTSHDAFQYFGRDYGLTFLAPQGLSTESEASAQNVARLIKQMRKQGIAAVFIENITDKRLLEQIARET